ncbi:MAG: AMP-binding protein [FCB group bacterium]|nr:AMP-binding protein [FCB group bacterium]
MRADEPWLRQLGVFLQEWWDENPELFFRTSGSTGKPQTVRFTKDQCRESARRTLDYFSIKTGAKTCLCLPTAYVAGKMMVIRAITGSLDLVAVPPKMNPWDHDLPEIDFAAVTPQQLSDPEAMDQLVRVMNSEGILLVGGAPIPEPTRRKISDIEIPVFETYGMTETLTHVAVKRISHPTEPLFTAFPDVSLDIDARNCLTITAPYLGPDRIQTRDIVRLEDSTRFEWVGRLDRVINSGGVKIQPEDIEARIGEELTNHLFFIHPLPDKRFGEKVVLWVEGDPGSGMEADIAEIVQSIPGLERPREYHILPRFQRTSTGKIDRQGTVAEWLEKGK